MKFKLHQLVAAVAVATASLASTAAPKDLGTNPGFTPVSAVAVDAGFLSFSYSFILDSATSFSALSGAFSSWGSDVTLTADLTGPTPASTTFLVTPSVDGTFSFGPLADGVYQLTLTGSTSSGITPYGGFITSAAAVPEPESIAMALAGLGVAGMLVRRRKA